MQQFIDQEKHVDTNIYSRNAMEKQSHNQRRKRGRDRRITIETSQPNKQGNMNDYLDDDQKKAWKPIQKYISSIPLHTRISTFISGIEILQKQ